jgi:hypothetical protein
MSAKRIHALTKVIHKYWVVEKKEKDRVFFGRTRLPIPNKKHTPMAFVRRFTNGTSSCRRNHRAMVAPSIAMRVCS